jgi:hypothetical protein
MQNEARVNTEQRHKKATTVADVSAAVVAVLRGRQYIGAFSEANRNFRDIF